MAQLRTRKESKNILKSSLANHLLTFLARHRWLGEYDNFLERNLFQSVYGQGFALLTRSTQNFWRGLSVPACFGWLAHLSRPCLSTIPILIYRRGATFWRIPFANLYGWLLARQNPHACPVDHLPCTCPRGGSDVQHCQHRFYTSKEFTWALPTALAALHGFVFLIPFRPRSGRRYRTS